MSGKMKKHEAEIEKLKSSCAVIDKLLSDIKQDYALLDEEHFTLAAHYQQLRELDKSNETDNKTHPLHRYLTDEELALFADPAPGPSSDHNVTKQAPDTSSNEKPLSLSMDGSLVADPVPGPSSLA